MAADGGDRPVVVKGREEAVYLMDLMMSDPDFMQFQDDLITQMEDNLGDGYTTVGGDGDDETAQVCVWLRCLANGANCASPCLQ